MKILIIGGSGMLGHKLLQKWNEKFDVWTTIRGNLDDYRNFEIFNSEKTLEKISAEDIASVKKVIEFVQPNVIVNAVGVIKQIPTARDVIKTLTINSIFPNQLIELAKTAGARLITISTDCVFSGSRGNYTETDLPDASDLYGKSKQFGEIIEKNCLTIRTSIIGRELKTSHSFLEWFLKNPEPSVNGYKNAVFSGFPTIILANILADVIENYPALEGLYHVSSEPINKFDLLNLIKEAYQSKIEIKPFEDFVIDRSLNSDKFRQTTGFQPLDWKEMVAKMAEDNAIYKKENELNVNTL